MEINNLRNFALVGIASAVMLGCGGSGDSGTTTGSTDITTVGAITGFGSVYVNGVKYETDNAEYEVEDEVHAIFDFRLLAGPTQGADGTPGLRGVKIR